MIKLWDSAINSYKKVDETLQTEEANTALQTLYPRDAHTVVGIMSDDMRNVSNFAILESSLRLDFDY